MKVVGVVLGKGDVAMIVVMPASADAVSAKSMILQFLDYWTSVRVRSIR